jgi:hypothetical protein
MALCQGSSEDIKPIEEANKAMVENIEEKFTKLLKDISEEVVKAVKAKINFEPLLSALDPFDRFGDMLKPLIGVFPDVSPHLPALKYLVEYRTQILKYDISKGPQGVEDILDRSEGWIYWRSWWVQYEYRDEIWKLYYLCYGIPELCNFRYVFRSRGFQFARFQRKFMRKWSYIFGDYLHEGAKTATPATWQNVVNSCFLIGYQKAVEWWKPKAQAFLVSLIHEWVYHFIGTKIEAFAIKALEPVVSALAATVPSPLNQVVEIEEIANESVVDALHQTVDKLVVDTILTPASKAWAGSAFAKS